MTIRAVGSSPRSMETWTLTVPPPEIRSLVLSDAYARAVGETPPVDASQRTFAAQSRRRLSAEQVVDSLFAAAICPLFRKTSASPR